MKVFISWSGNKSHKVGLIFRDWLPSVIQNLEPYVSSEDIDKGARWSTDIAKELEDSTFGILCVTKENLHAPWLSFEAGALSKTMDKAFVSPFLFDIKRSEVNGPILQFQSTIFNKEDIKKLVYTLNKACGEGGLQENRLEKAFGVWYPTLETELNKLRDVSESDESEIISEDHSSTILEEILELSRDNQKLLRNPDPKILENTEEVKEKINELCMQRDRYLEIDDKRMLQKYQIRFIDEFVHMELPKCQSYLYAFLITLSFFQEDFPWIYNMGKELVDILSSNKKNVMKKNALYDFRHMLEFTCEHPMMREIYGRKRDSGRLLRELPYLLLKPLEEFAEHLEIEY